MLMSENLDRFQADPNYHLNRLNYPHRSACASCRNVVQIFAPLAHSGERSAFSESQRSARGEALLDIYRGKRGTTQSQFRAKSRESALKDFDCQSHGQRSGKNVCPLRSPVFRRCKIPNSLRFICGALVSVIDVGQLRTPADENTIFYDPCDTATNGRFVHTINHKPSSGRTKQKFIKAGGLSHRKKFLSREIIYNLKKCECARCGTNFARKRLGGAETSPVGNETFGWKGFFFWFGEIQRHGCDKEPKFGMIHQKSLQDKLAAVAMQMSCLHHHGWKTTPFEISFSGYFGGNATQVLMRKVFPFL